MSACHSHKELLVLQTIEAFPWLSMEDLAARCPQLAWNELFGAVDAMSRRGVIRLFRQGFQYLAAPHNSSLSQLETHSPHNYRPASSIPVHLRPKSLT